MDLLEQAKKSLTESSATFVMIRGGKTFSSEMRGVAPILDLLREDPDALEDGVVADKVIGKAAALLLMYGRIKALYTKVISSHALNVLKDSGIEVVYDKLVPYVINRDGTDMCPMEKLVLEIGSPEEAFEALDKKILVR